MAAKQNMSNIKIKPNTVIYNKSLFLSNSMRECLSKNYFAVNQDFDISLPFINDMLNNHRKCPYWTLLKQFCPSDMDSKKREWEVQRKKHRRISSSQLLKNHAATHNVYLYIRTVAKHVIPLKALGSKHNFHCFMRHIKKMLSVQMYGQISLDHMTDGIKTKSIVWLQSHCQSEKASFVKKMIHFFITRVICPLIQSFFYVTGSTSCKNKLFFYRKKSWHCLRQRASNQFIRSCKLSRVSQQWVQAKLKEGKCLGVSNVRFLMKSSSSLRPVVNLSRVSNNRASVNDHLKALLHVLTFEKENTAEVFGATVFSVEDIHDKWRQFVTECRDQMTDRLYFVKVDIERCYDTINPCLLYSIISRIVKKSFYKIYKYRKIFHRNGQIRSVYFESCKHPNDIYCNRKAKIENCGSYVVAREVLLGKLCALLFCNVAKLGSQHYVQTLGIPQGSVLSSILCGAYYGYMDRAFLNGVRSRGDLLLRLVDDMLYVTSCRRNAERMLRTMLDGVPEFNCRCNLKKCCVSFHYHHAIVGDVPCIPIGSPMKFCGLAFDTLTLNVYLDFSNYENIQAHDTVSWDLTRHPGSIIRSKIISHIHPKCLPILFDKEINCPDSIYYNILCIFSMCAVKFHCLVMQLPPKRRALNNPKFFTKIILELPQALIASSSQKLASLGSVKTQTFPVPAEIVHGLCVQSFLFKLKVHHQMYAPVIERLQQVQTCQLDDQVFVMLPQIFQGIYIK